MRCGFPYRPPASALSPCAAVTRILIVDDHPTFRACAREALEAAGFEVVGEAGDASEALEAVARLRPDVVLLDVQLPDATGFEVCDCLCAGAGPPWVVLTSTRDASDYGGLLASSRARGFIPKDELSGDALRALLA